MKRFILILVYFVVNIPAISQKLEYLNKHKYSIVDQNKVKPEFYKITVEDSLQKSVRIFTMDSSLVYQRMEKLKHKKHPFSSVEIWYSNSSKKEKVVAFSQKKERRESTIYYESGIVKSHIIEENNKLKEEKYFSENGQPIAKPKIETALPNGGLEGWTNYLSQNLIYPETARRLGFEGLVYLIFIVDEEGKMEDIEVMNPEENNYLLNQEALRVAKTYPYLWTPTRINGKVERSVMRLPIRFKLT